MAQDKPTQLPEWASSPPVAPPTTITEPSSPTKQVGFQPGFLRRQYLNWWMNLTYQCLGWIFQAWDKVMDLIFVDQAFSDGSAPTLNGASLAILAADFSARVKTAGFVIGPVDSPAYNYTASKDTYWDLGRDGQWHASVVNNGAGAPAVYSNSVRCFKVVTNGTGRTAVTDYRNTYARIDKVFDFGQIRLGEYLRSTSANLNLARIYARWKGGTSTGYTYIGDFENDAGDLIASRIYIRHSDGSICIVRGARYGTTDNDWSRDAGATFATMEVIGSTQKEYHKLGWISVSDPFPDAEWYDAETSSNGRSQKLDFNGGIRAGNNLNRSDYERTGLFRIAGKIFGGHLLEAAADFGPMKFYAFPGETDLVASDTGDGGCITANCYYDVATSKWKYLNPALPFATLLSIDTAGVVNYTHIGSDDWDHAIGSGDWLKGAVLNADGQMGSLALSQTGGSSPAKNTLFKSNLVKAYARIQLDGAGGCVLKKGFGIDTVSPPAIVGSDVVVNLQVAFASTDVMVPIVTMGASGGNTGLIVQVNNASTTQLEIRLRDYAGVTVDPGTTGVTRTINLIVMGDQP